MPILFNSRDEAYKSPFGAVRAGEEVLFRLRLPVTYHCITPMLLLEKEGEAARAYPLQPELPSPGEAPKTRTGRKKAPAEDVFFLRLTIDAPGLYFYWFDLYVDYIKLYRGDGGEARPQTEDGEKYALTVYDPAYQTPASVQGGVMYQIFPDRFLEGNPEKPLIFSERIYRADKQNEPYFWAELKSYGSLTQDFYGGDLAGIEKRLPFLHSLGVTYIYLNPIFEAHSNHRYNTADYFKVDPYLGSNEDFAQLCQTAKAFGIKIILDGVFSHTGSDSVYFNKEGRYPSVGAWQGPQSPYRTWYTFHPDGSYDSWWGFETLPACNKNNHDFRRFICEEGGVIDFWLGLGASGFRLDVADELPDDFIAQIRQAVKRNSPNHLLLGEVWEDASLKVAYGARRRYFLGNELDGVMNYPFRSAILRFLKDFDTATFASSIMELCENYPAPALAATTIHLSTHDTVRAITELVGEPLEDHSRDWQSGRRLSPQQYHLGIVRMRLAFVLQFTLPGLPCVYYGDEIAMQGYADPFNRGYYDWTSGESALIPLMMRLAQLRKDCAAFASTRIRFVTAKGGVLVYERWDERAPEDSRLMVAINCSNWPVVVNLLGEELTLPIMDFAIRATDAVFEDTGIGME